MVGYVKKGFGTALRQPFALLVLFLYQFVWGFALYRYVSSVVVPLMQRYPGGAHSDMAALLFLAEGQFRLAKTDLIQPYLLTLLGLFLARMAMTPILNAGVYFSLHHTEYNAGYRFVQGIRCLSGPFLIYYALRILLTLAPLYWLIPLARNVYLTATGYDQIALRLLPYAAAYLVYGYLVHLCFTYVQLAKTTDGKPLKSMPFLIRRSLRIAAVALAMVVVSGLVTFIAVAASLIWAGFLALVLYQFYRFAHAFCQIWTLSAHYQVWWSGDVRRQ
jgi:hypothetical protein